MRWAIILLLAGGGAIYLYQRKSLPPPTPPPPPLSTPTIPAPILSEAELAKVRASADDSDPTVRWRAVQLLMTLHDPKASEIVEKVLSQDTDADVRTKVIQLLRADPNYSNLHKMIRGLQDYEKSVRLASLQAIAEIGDPSVAPYVVGCLNDTEPEVRTEALRTLGRFEEKRKADFDALVAKLREEYEQAVKRRKGTNLMELDNGTKH